MFLCLAGSLQETKHHTANVTDIEKHLQIVFVQSPDW